MDQENLSQYEIRRERNIQQTGKSWPALDLQVLGIVFCKGFGSVIVVVIVELFY